MAAVTVYSAPDDGCPLRPKHVEHTLDVNKHNTARVASFWFIIYCTTLCVAFSAKCFDPKSSSSICVVAFKHETMTLLVPF